MVRSDIGQFLDCAGGPLDAHNIHVGCIAEAKLSAEIILARQSAAAGNLAQLQQAWNDAGRQCGARMTTLIADDLAKSINELQALQLLAPA